MIYMYKESEYDDSILNVLVFSYMLNFSKLYILYIVYN